MFVKPFRVKNSVTVRNSDRRKLKKSLLNFYPSIPEDDPALAEVLPAKGDLKETKVLTHKGEQVLVYQLSDEPVLIQTNSGILLPYLYALWRHDLRIPVLHTHPDVVQRLARGADFMAPGIVFPPDGIDSSIQKQKAVMIKVAGSRHPFAIGLAEFNADELRCGVAKGKAVRILSVVGDTLWASGSKFIPPDETDPDFKPNESLMQEFKNLLADESGEQDVASSPAGTTESIDIAEPLDAEPMAETVETAVEEAEGDAKTLEEIRKEHDDILTFAFKKAIKTRVQMQKESLLPMLCSTFYSQHLLNCVPAGAELQMKKTSFKKLSVFLAQLEEEGVVKVVVAAKGVEKIASVDFKNIYFRGFQAEMEDKEATEETPEERPMVEVLGATSNKDSYSAPVITQLYAVSGQVSDMFVQAGCGRSAVLSMAEVRDFITKYVDTNQLRKGAQVAMDPLLHRAVYGKGNEEKEFAKWDKVFGAISAKMNPAYSIQFQGQSQCVIKKGKLPKMNIAIKKVAGNKSVTLVTGFEGFLMQPEFFAELMRKKAQASTSIGPDVSGKFVQVLIQGNQTRHVETILTVNFNIDKRFIIGLENAKPAKKGKKK